LSSTLLPVVALVIAAAVVAFAARRRARQRWANRRISGGRKALVLNLFDRA
jgi:cytochrome c-type biogenesis protein CcmH/NrfF